MKKILCFLIVLFFRPIIGNTQQVIPLHEVDAIVYEEDDSRISLYQKVRENQFKRIFLYFDNEDFKEDTQSYLDLVTWEIYIKDKIQTLAEILGEKGKIIYIKDLRPSTLDDFVGKIFEVDDDNKWRREKEANRIVFKFPSHEIVARQELYYGEYKQLHGFGSSIISDDDDQKKWRVYEAYYYLPFVLDFGDGRSAYLAKDKSYTVYTLLPMKQGDFIISDEGSSRIKSTTKYESTIQSDFYEFMPKRFWGLRLTTDNKCELINAFGKNVLDRTYDTITYENKFLIAKDGDEIEVFNFYKRKLDLGEVKSAYIHQSERVEVLNENGANYYDTNGKESNQSVKMSFSLCGTVSETDYIITKSGNTHRLTITDTSPGTPEYRIEEYILADRTEDEAVSFVNDQMEFEWNENNDFMGSKYLYPQLLKIGRNGKYGIAEYFYKPDSLVMPDTIITYDPWKETRVIFPVKSITGKVRLPIENDSIVFGKDGLFYFYNDKKIGIFPHHKTTQYEAIEQKTQSFYYIIRDGKGGWLDIRTNKEYFSDSPSNAPNK